MKIAFYLTRPKTETETSVYARISYNGSQLKYYTTESIAPNNWNKEKQRAKQSAKFKEFPEFNARIDKIETTIKDVFRTYQNDNANMAPSPALLKNLLDKEFEKNSNNQSKESNLKTFWGFFDDFLNRTKSGSRLHLQNNTPLALNTIKNYKNLYRHLREFESYERKKIDFATIDLRFYQVFTQYLTEHKKLAINTIGKLITNLKVLLREAAEIGVSKNLVFTQRKFKSYQTDTEAIYLTESEINDLISLDLSSNKRLEKVRDLFVIGCHTGLRFSDLSKLSYNNITNNIIKIRQTKTGNISMIPIKEEISHLFAKYPDALPGNISNQKFNSYLKELCAMVTSLHKEVSIQKIVGGKKIEYTFLKYELVKSHTARRSFATNEYLAGDLQAFEIRVITGHKTDKAFYKYIRQSPHENATNVAKKWQIRHQNQLQQSNLLKVV